MSTSSPEDTFPFLSLPPELRQHIYGFCTPLNERFDIHTFYPERKVVRDRERRDARLVTARKSSLPQLLRTCRQINNEAKRLLYRNNVFVSSKLLINRPWPKMKFFGPESQKEVRHMSFRLSRPGFDFTNDTCPIDESWANMLGSLSTPELIVANYYHGESEDANNYYDGKWTKNLKDKLEAIKRLVPEDTRIMVDVDGNRPLLKVFGEIVPNRCIFGRLESRDELFRRGKYTPTPEQRAEFERKSATLQGFYNILYPHFI
ncbi:unnamed protein product [Fusarium equiseti]|uniref:2EXR domain-containing protein n=1 Tax=Fusarium equiseti TaxID=61235 RepID=A0A8J2NEU5_FUSEQ|nr:unnamed protein product [Fusarium equiseti]